ncbi:MAG: hypothetical protein AAF740_02590 [Bacteroidota bacterium]
MKRKNLILSFSILLLSIGLNASVFANNPIKDVDPNNPLSLATDTQFQNDATISLDTQVSFYLEGSTEIELVVQAAAPEGPIKKGCYVGCMLLYYASVIDEQGLQSCNDSCDTYTRDESLDDAPSWDFGDYMGDPPPARVGGGNYKDERNNKDSK